MSLRKFISYLFFPLTMWYAVGVALRNFLFAIGVKRQHAPHITTIGVGNLSTGGTGKSPHVEYLLRLLADKYRTAMLSRGYKRKSKGFVLDDGTHDPLLLGDEPAMMARKFPQVQVAVCEKRMEGVKRLMEVPEAPDPSDSPNLSDSPVVQDSTERHQPPQLIVFDDVFQHRAIRPSINILLTEYDHPYFSDSILPYGNLREFRSGRFRASIVIVTKSPAKLNPVEKHNIIHDLRLQNYQKVFFSYFQYDSLQTLDGRNAGIELRQVSNVLAVTGIAHPKQVLDELRRSTKVQHMAFPDHHNYTSRDIAHIRNQFESMPGESKIIVTTEKDAVRLKPLAKGLPVYVLPVRVAFHQDGDMSFDQLIESSVKENISFLGKLSIWS